MIAYIALTLLVCFFTYSLWQWKREQFFVEMKGKYVLISGCDSGFGRRLTEKLLMAGVNVFAGVFTDSGADSLQKECGELAGKLFPVKLDITSQKSVDACFDFVVGVLKRNEASLWSLVNNAGFLAVYGPMDWIGVEEYEQSISVNLVGAIRMSKKFTSLIKQSHGRIVTMISASGRCHGFYTAPYVAAKFGLEGYVDNLRLELKPFGVKVVTLEPGAFRTNIMSPEAMIQRVESVWSKLTPEAQDEYGIAFKDNYIHSFNNGASLVASRNIDVVADAYVHAIFGEHPRIRYVCGWDAKFILIPLSFMPSAVQDALIQAMMNITSGYSKPAVLENNNHLKINLNAGKPVAAAS